MVALFSSKRKGNRRLLLNATHSLTWQQAAASFLLRFGVTHAKIRGSRQSENIHIPKRLSAPQGPCSGSSLCGNWIEAVAEKIQPHITWNLFLFEYYFDLTCASEYFTNRRWMFWKEVALSVASREKSLLLFLEPLWTGRFVPRQPSPSSRHLGATFVYRRSRRKSIAANTIVPFALKDPDRRGTTIVQITGIKPVRFTAWPSTYRLDATADFVRLFWIFKSSSAFAASKASMTRHWVFVLRNQQTSLWP